MTYKELMTVSLTELLEDGETLQCPIYGILNQGNTQFYGYFGFTETHFLIALISGKQISYTIRIPLDIKSVNIKQAKVSKQYTIDIGFHDGAPCRITASPKVFMIDTQQENLTQFLNFLKSKSPKRPEIELKDMDGVKIRRQYFNTFIYLMLAFIPMAPVMIIVAGLKENNLDFAGMVETILITVFVSGALLSPLLVLSLLNRFFFGKIIGIVNDEGLHLENNFIPWKDIQKIVYTPEISSRTKVRFTFATIFVRPPHKTEFTYDIIHFPIYGLRKIKKLYPEIEVRLDKNSLFFILLMALTPTIASVILSLVM